MDVQIAPKPGEVRFHELDALRGLAAVTVMFHHFEILWFPPATLPRWATLLSPLTDGLEAVVLFFMLSGFVLSVPLLRNRKTPGKSQPYPVYLARRTLRLYAPYLIALGLSVAGAAVWHRAGPGDSVWTAPVSARLLLDHILFLGNYNSGEYNTAFWSLVQEMRVSLVFPLLFLIFHRIRPLLAVPLAALLTMLAFRLMLLGKPVGPWAVTLLYIPIFLIGILLAAHVAAIRSWYQHLPGSARVAFGLTSFVLYTWGMHLAAQVHTFINLHVFPIDQWLITAGAAGYLILAMNAPRIRAFLNTRVPQFLGRISYSLYLVHGTVLFALSRSLGRRIPVPVQFLLFVVLSIALGYAFCLAVEEPFLRLGRKVGSSKPRLATHLLEAQN